MSKRRLPENLSVETLAIRAAELRTDEMSHSEALFLTSSFAYENAAQAAARFAGTEPGNIYSRFTNPTVRSFEERLAALEGGERDAVAAGRGHVECGGWLAFNDVSHLISAHPSESGDPVLSCRCAGSAARLA